MNVKRWLSGAAASLMLLSMAGCGSAGSGGGTGVIPIDSVSLPEKLDSNVIKVLGYQDWEKEADDIKKILKDAYGATVEYTVLTDWRENDNKIAQDLAAGIAYDFVLTGKNLYDKGLIEPLDPYFDFNDPIFQNTKDIIDEWRMDDGKAYMTISTTFPQVILYNKDIFANNGLEDPLVTYEKGEWNFDTFMDVCKALSNDDGEDGRRIYGFSSWDPTNFLTANGTYYLKKGKDGNSELNLDDPKFVESLNYFRELAYTNKAFTSWQGWSFPDFQTGNLPMMMERFGNKTASTDFDFDWDFVPFPVGPSGDPNKTPGTIGAYGIGKGAKNPTGGAAYIYLFCRQDYLKRGEYLRSYLSEEQAQRYEKLMGMVKPLPHLDGAKDMDNLMYDIMNGGDVAAKIEEYRPVWQAQMDDYAKAATNK